MHPIIHAQKDQNFILWKDLIKKFFVPKRKYPFYFKFDNWEGYLALHDKNITIEKLVSACRNFDKKFLGSLESDYLIFGVNEEQNQLNIISSVSGKFPLYFSAFGNDFIASTDFGEVFKVLPRVKIDFDSLLDYLFTDYSFYITDKTFINGVYKLPPGCLLKVNHNFEMSIEQIIDAGEFLKDKPERNQDIVNFRNELLQKLNEVVFNLVESIKDLPISADLSSGFDSPLVNFLLKNQDNFQFKSFCFLSNEDKGDTIKELVEKFARKHNLDLSIIDVTDLHPFVNKEELEWNKNHFFPGTHFLPIGLKFYQYKREILGGNYATFNGHGGDELYMAYLLHFNLDKIIKDEIDWVKEGIRAGIGKIFTDKALEILLDEKRLRRNKIYFSPIAPTALQWFTFPLYWQYGNWEISPYNNLSLIKLAMKIPKIDRGRLKKHQLWQGRTDIFLPEQFKRIKKPFDHHLLQMFDKKPDFLIEVLSNSVLEEIGLIKASQMINAIKENKSRDYFKNLLPIFVSTIRLEFFLQSNGFVSSIP